MYEVRRFVNQCCNYNSKLRLLLGFHNFLTVMPMGKNYLLILGHERLYATLNTQSFPVKYLSAMSVCSRNMAHTR